MNSIGGYNIGEINEKVKKSFWEETKRQVIYYVKKLVEDVLQGCRQEAAGCLWHERSELRNDYCNGYYPRSIESVYGQVQIRVPRLRKGGYVHELFERYQRRSDELSDAIKAAYLRGHSTRGVSAYMDEVFGVSLSAGGISRVLRSLDEELEKFHGSPLEDSWDVVYLDGMHVKVEDRDQVVLLAWGEDRAGDGKCLGFRLAETEAFDAWWRFLIRLWQRGLKGAGSRLFVHDGAGGLKKALEEVYPGQGKQLCIVHKLRDLREALRRSPRRDRIMKRAKVIYEAPSAEEARSRMKELMRCWRRWEPQAIELFSRDFEKTLSFYGMEKRFWMRVRTTNPIERFIREIRRRIRPMGRFVNAQSCKRLTFGVIHDIQLRRYGLKKPSLTPQNEITQFH